MRLFSFSRLLLLPGLVGAANAQFGQQVFGAHTPQPGYNSAEPNDHTMLVNSMNMSWAATVQSLSSLSSDDFTTLQHPAFPEHSVRIKHAKDFCDPTVRAYSGYLDFQARHLFFYFFESRNDPENDPLLMWINGGPGASSSLGLFMELGPCLIDTRSKEGSSNQTIWNPYGWNANASIFFLDQPVGVGFSYADYGLEVSSTEDAAKDVYAFIFLFLEHFASFKGRPLHLSGESYGGRYLPVFASEIVDNNRKAVEAGYEPINLQSVLIGNGFTEIYTMWESYYDLQCKNASYPPVQSIKTCVRMKRALPRCLSALKEQCVDRYDSIGCAAAAHFCGSEVTDPFYATGRNPYDISKMCEGPVEETACYALTSRISAYLDQPHVRHLLGVDVSVKNHTTIALDVNSRFSLNGDEYRQTHYYVAGLLERGIKVLIYVGTYDWICNWIGNMRWTEELEWTGHEDFAAQGLREWTVDGNRAGITRSARGLTYATVENAGHMVPYDKPVQALAMLNRWLAGGQL